MVWGNFIFFLIIINILFFTSPNAKDFHKLKNKQSDKIKNDSKDTPFLNDDFEDSQDKEFYKLRKEMQNKIILEDIIEEEEKDSVSINSSKIKSKKTSDIITVDKDNESEIVRKSNTWEENNNSDININTK